MKKYAAEFVGTFVLVFGGCAVLAGEKIGFLGVSLAFGLSVLAMAYAIGPISGCHINPAVTLGLFLSKKMPARDVGPYVAAQILGGLLAAGLLLVIRQGRPERLRPAGVGLRGQRLRGPLAGRLRPRLGLPRRSRPDLLPGLHGAGFDRHQGAGRLRGHPHRSGAGADPPRRHPRDEHVGQPGPEHQPGRVRRRLGAGLVVAVHPRPVHRRGHRVGRLHRAADGGPRPRPPGLGAAGRVGPREPAGRAGMMRADRV